MAFQSESDILNTLNGGQGGQGGSGLIDPTSTAPQAGSQGSAVVSGAGGQGQTGTGGTRPFVNIQSYLQGNAPTQSTANIVSQDVGGIIGGEKQTAQTKSTEAKTKGQDEQKEIIGVDAATKQINAAAQGQGDTSQVKASLDAQYDKPVYDYAQSSNYQNLGQNFQSGDDYNVASGSYQRHLGQSMSGGQNLLQRQLDAVNPYMRDTMGTVKNDYSNATKEIGDISTSTIKELDDLGDTYRNNQNALRKGVYDYGQDQSIELDRLVNEINTHNANTQGRYQSDIDYINSLGSDANRFIEGGMGDYSNFYDYSRGTAGSDPTWVQARDSQGRIIDGDTLDSVQDAMSLARSMEYQEGTAANRGNVNPLIAKEYNLIADLLGQGVPIEIAQDQAKKAVYDPNRKQTGGVGSGGNTVISNRWGMGNY
jgi:hypothetical protein